MGLAKFNRFPAHDTNRNKQTQAAWSTQSLLLWTEVQYGGVPLATLKTYLQTSDRCDTLRLRGLLLVLVLVWVFLWFWVFFLGRQEVYVHHFTE